MAWHSSTENRMQGANYIIAADRDGAPAVYDAYGQGAVGATHPEDTEIGGSDDLVASAVSVQGGVVRLEAQIPLDSGDQYDKVLQPGETYPIIVATGTFCSSARLMISCPGRDDSTRQRVTPDARDEGDTARGRSTPRSAFRAGPFSASVPRYLVLTPRYGWKAIPLVRSSGWSALPLALPGAA